MFRNLLPSWPRFGVAVLVAALCGIVLLPSLRGDETAEMTLKRFAERLAEPSGDRDKLRSEILDFRTQHPGTPLAAQASALLSRLRSPLDKLKAANIPALERFPNWQPKELVAVVGEHRGRHGTIATCVACSPDGNLIASGGGGYVRLWDAHTLRLHSLIGHSSATSVAFRRDSKALAIGGAGGIVTVCDVNKDKQMTRRFSVTACSSVVYSVAFAPDGKSVAAGCFDNAVRVYDVSGAKMEDLATLNEHKQQVSAVSYAADGRTFASGSYDKTIRLWNVRGKEFTVRSVLEGHPAAITSVAFSSKGSLASADTEGNVLLWGAPGSGKHKPLAAVSPKAGAVYALSYSPGGGTLALACGDGTARLWSVGGTPRERAKLEGHAALVYGVAYAPDGRTLVTGSGDWTVRSWDVSSGKPKERFMPWSHLSVIHGLDFSLDLKTLVTGSEDRVIRLWDLTKTDLKTRAYLKSDDKVPIYAVAYSPDGKTVAAGGAGLHVRQWDANVPSRTRPTLKTPSIVKQLLYSPDSRFLLTRSQKTVILWDARSSGEVRRFTTQEMDVHCAAWSPDGKRLLTGHGVPLMKEGKYVYAKNGGYVYTDCLVRLFDVDSGDELYQDKSFTMPVYSAGFSVDGRQAFTGLYEPSLRVWEMTAKELKPAGQWKGSSGYVHLLRFSPDGKHAVTSGLDGQLVLWDPARGKPIKQWTFHEQIANAAFASDSRHLAVALTTGVVYVLRLAAADDKS